MDRYVIAVRRDKRGEYSVDDVLDNLRGLPDVKVVAEGKARLRVDVPSDLVSEIKRRMSDWCHIEQFIPHSPQIQF